MSDSKRLTDLRKLEAFAGEAEHEAFRQGLYRLGHLVRLGGKAVGIALEEYRRREKRAELEAIAQALTEPMEAKRRQALNKAAASITEELEDITFDRRRARYDLLDQTAITAGILEELEKLEPVEVQP